MSIRIPRLKKIANVPPSAEMLAHVGQPDFSLGCFTNGYPYPPELESLLTERGLEFIDHGQGMLFASRSGVTVHSDEWPAVLWFWEAVDNTVELLAGSQRVMVDAGDVFLCDTSKDHGVIHCDEKLRRWSVFSAYIGVIPKKHRKPNLVSL